MAKTKQSKNINTKKHMAREQREAKQTRIIIIVTAVIGAIILGLVGYGAVSQLIIRPNKPVAQVGDTVIEVRELESQVKYTRVQMLNQTYQYYSFYQQFGEFGQSFLQTAQSMVTQLIQPVALGQDVLDEMINSIIIHEEAAKRGISASEEEINEALYQAFGFYPNGTSTPTTTATIQATPTYSETQLALVTLTFTPTSTELPTETPEPSPTAADQTEGDTDTGEDAASDSEEPEAVATEVEEAVGTPTPELSPTITLTPTPYTTEIFAENIDEFEDLYSPYNFDYNDLRDIFEVEILREKLKEEISKDLEPVQEEVWARHILVETEEEALEVLSRIDDGEEFVKLAAIYSTDESNKDNGGDLSWFSSNAMVPEFSEAAFSLEVGEISEPVETNFGFHIIQVLGKRESQTPPDEFEQQKQQAFIDWLNDTRDNRTDIIIYDGWEEYIPDTPEVPQQLLIELYQQGL